METLNIETNDWDWELVPNSDEHHHSTPSPSFRGGGVIRSDYFSPEGEEFENRSWVDHVNQGFTGIDHLGFSHHFAKSSEIVLNSGNIDVVTDDTVTGFSVDFAKSSEIVQNSGDNDVGIIISVTGFSDYFGKSSEIVQNSGNNDVENNSVANSSESVQNSGNNDAGIINSVTGFSDDFAKSSEIAQNSVNNDVENNSVAKSSGIVQNNEGINSLTGFSDNFAKSLGIVQDSVTGFSDKPSEIVHQNSGNEDAEINSVTVTVLSNLSSKLSETVDQNSGNDAAESFISGECAEEQEQEQEQEQHGDCLNSEDDEEKKREQNVNEKRVVWWKVPLEVLKYCVLRVSPVWSLSMAAAALMGFVLLRRRYLYKMKGKSMGVQKVTVHDKVSQLMSQAARLNEAFSVVKRVPIIRPVLPAPGMASWPVMSLR